MKRKLSNTYQMATGARSKIQYTGWTDPCDALVEQGHSIISKTDIIGEQGFAVGAGVERIVYMVNQDIRVGYSVWSAGIDEVVYSWMGNVGESRVNLLRAALSTYIYKSLLRNQI